MNTFIKAQSASFFASAFDLLCTMICVQFLGVWYLSGSIFGTIAGGCLNFILGHNWVFKPGSRNIRSQFIRYLLVWTGNLLLIAGGVSILTHLAGFNYIYAKILVSLSIGLIYNYIMHKRYVFVSL
jgi:putative flippase GtrA